MWRTASNLFLRLFFCISIRGTNCLTMVVELVGYPFHLQIRLDVQSKFILRYGYEFIFKWRQTLNFDKAFIFERGSHKWFYSTVHRYHETIIYSGPLQKKSCYRRREIKNNLIIIQSQKNYFMAIVYLYFHKQTLEKVVMVCAVNI